MGPGAELNRVRTYEPLSLPYKALIANVTKVVSGSGAAQLITLLSSFAITRLFTPGTYGEAAIILAIVTILTVFSTLRYNQAIVLPKDEQSAAAVTVLCFINTVFISALIALLLLFNSATVANLIGLDSSQYWLVMVIPVGVFIYGVLDTLNGVLIRMKLYGKHVVVLLVIAIAGALGKIASGMIWGDDVLFLVVFPFLAALLGIAYAMPSIRGIVGPNIHKLNITIINNVLHTYRQFPKYGIANGFLNRSGKLLPVFVLGYFYVPEIVGLFAIAYTVIRMPIGVVGQSMRKVYIQHMASLIHDNNLNMMIKTYRDSVVGLLLAGLLPLVIILIWAEPLFSFAFGDQWTNGGEYARALAPWSLVWLMGNIPTATFVVMEKQNVLFLYQVSLMFMRLVVLIAGAMYYTPVFVIGMYSVVSVCVYVIMMIHVMQLLRQYVSVH